MTAPALTAVPDAHALEVRLLLEAIRARYGYDFTGYVRASMERRVAAALQRSGFAHLGELQHRLLVDPGLFPSVVEALTVQVSALFRDPPLFAALRRDVAPSLRTWPTLKVWHCGCAQGEELYSAAIVLAEVGLLPRSQLYGTDLSARALAAARLASWPERDLEGFARGYLASGGTGRIDDWVARGWGGFALLPALTRHAHFFQHDVGGDETFGEMQLVFCRNVLIYFGDALRARALARLQASLCPGGFLCLGASERLTPRELDAGFTVFDSKHRIYRWHGGRP